MPLISPGTMRLPDPLKRFLATADRVLLHPWTSRLGGVQAIVGAGILAGGLAGGVVSLIFGFPAAWAIVTAVGAFLLGSSAMATLVERWRAQALARPPTPPELQPGISEAQREVRRAAGWILEDVEAARALFEAALETGQWWAKENKLTFIGWSETGEALSIHGRHEAHKAVRTAVNRADHVEVLRRDVWEQWLHAHDHDPLPGSRPAIHQVNRVAIEDATHALKAAEVALEEVQRS